MKRHLVVFWAFLALASLPALADVSYPAKPGPRDFIHDGAKLLSPEDAAAIKAAADKLLTDKDIAVVVATIDSMSGFGASGWPIERYAMNLFDEWGIGRTDHNYGILLLVSKGDRKARIELGKAFNRERDEECTRIMQGTIVPRFKQGDFSGGIKAGVLALDGMARGTGIPAAPNRAPTQQSQSSSSAPIYTPSQSLGHRVASAKPSFIGPLVCVGVGLVVIVAIIVVVAARRSMGGGYGGGAGPGGGVLGGGMGGGWGGGWGGGGWGGGWGGSSMPPWWWWVPGPGSGHWGSGGGIFGGSSSRSSSSDYSGGFGGGGGGGFSGGGGSFGGGSFGGGFSGGGGSTGSW